MATEGSVICPGVVFSSLLCEQFGFPEVQEGFLLGSSIEHTSTQICDADMNKQTTTNVTYVSSYHCLDMLGCLYDSGCRVRDKTLDNVRRLAAENNQEIVGWYLRRSCESDAAFKVFLRERLVHMQLRDKLSNPQLLFLVFNWKNERPDVFPAVNCVLNIMEQNCRNKFKRVPLDISNLGNTSHTDYKLEPPNPGIYKCSPLAPIVAKLQGLEPGVAESAQLHSQLQESVQQQLLQLSEVQVQHSDKLQQLMVLRSLCYHNGIVPDYELPSAIDQEKEDVILQPEQLNNDKTSSSRTPSPASAATLTEHPPESVKHQASATSDAPVESEISVGSKKKQTNASSGAPAESEAVVGKKDTPRKRIVAKRLASSGSPSAKSKATGVSKRTASPSVVKQQRDVAINGLGEDLNKLTVNNNNNNNVGSNKKKASSPAPRAAKKSPNRPLSNSRVTNIKESPSSSPNGRLTSDSSASPPPSDRKPSSPSTGTTSRPSRPLTAGLKSKRRLPTDSSGESSSPSSADKSKTAWK